MLSELFLAPWRLARVTGAVAPTMAPILAALVVSLGALVAWPQARLSLSPTTLVSLLWLLALLGFALGAGVAAWTQTTRLPFLHGMVAAGGTYLAAQAVFVVIRLARGGTVHWLAIFFTFTATLFTGVIGGGLGSAMQARGITPGSTRRSSSTSGTGTESEDDRS